MAIIVETFLVSASFQEENDGVLIVGRKNIGRGVGIVNAFEDEEAWELYQKLKTVKKESSDER